jgi:glycosyltransferase involved in cell wall biosynthesis/ubiquinone/menaquinone biosynthesis C-methylase UbiE
MKQNLENIKKQLKNELIIDDENLKEGVSCIINDKAKLMFFVKEGLDSFLSDIIKGLSQEYEIKKVIITEYKQIDEGMKWADICWFEWCDELISYGSRLDLAKEKKIICRLHRYEALTENPLNVDWRKVEKLIIVTPHLKNFLLSLISDIESKVDIVTIVNGVNLNKYKMVERSVGFNIAYVGWIHSRKNPVLLLQIMNELVKRDKRYKLYIAGEFQDSLIKLYWYDQINKLGIEKNIVFEGWQKDVSTWLEDKNYILSTSIHESFGYGIAEAMSKGLKPIIHNFLFAEEIWDEKFMFNSVSEAVEMICDKNYNSSEYRFFIENKYSLDEQLGKIKDLLINLPEKRHKENLYFNYVIDMFNRFIPYSSKDLDDFNFDEYHIIIGKREIIIDNVYLIEFIVRNKFNEQLIITNIIHYMDTNKVIFPAYILNSKNFNQISELLNSLRNIKTGLSSNIEGYIFDNKILEKVEKNKLAYIWERGMPASQFMPALGWLRIIERYNFAVNFIKTSDIVLEAASGFGYGAAYIHDKCKKVYALDLMEENIEFGQCSYDFNNINWIKGDVTKLPFEDNKFDVYISFETLEHLSLDLVENYFKEAVRVLKENGIMIISTPNKEGRKNINNPFHIKEYNFYEFNELLKKYFSNIYYYSAINYKIESGVWDNTVNMISVCANSNIKIDATALHNKGDKLI